MTPREVIVSALRIVGAIKTGEAPTGDMFEDAREALNNMVALWSAEELMPYDITQAELNLWAGVPNYTVCDGSELDSNGICLSQTPGGAGNLTINGALASGGVATLDVPRHIIITSTADESGLTFTITGTNSYGDTISEAVTGPNTNTVRGYKQFKTVTQVAVSGAGTGDIIVGTDWILSSRRPVQIVDAFVRDSSGNDSPVFPITHDRYNEVIDKDEVGAPEKFYYRRSYPSGEIYVHPVPSSGIVLTVNTDVEHISNGAFDSGTGWTLGTNWSISSGVLTRSLTELITNGSFATDITGWTFTFSVSGTTTWEAGYLLSDSDASTFTMKQTISTPIVIGHTYHATWRAKANSTPSLKASLGNHEYQGGGVLTANWVDYEATLNPTNATSPTFGTNKFVLSTDGGDLVYIDDVVLTDLTASGTTTSQLSADLANALVTGDNYKVTFDVTDYAAGTCTPAVGDTNGSPINGNGSYSMYITCGAGTDFDLDASADFEGSIDNVSIINTGYDALAPIDYQLFLDCWLPFVEFGPEDIDTEINLPGAYVMAMRWGLASELTPEYGKNVSLYVEQRAKMYLDAIRFSNTRLPKPTLINWPVPVTNQQAAINRN